MVEKVNYLRCKVCFLFNVTDKTKPVIVHIEKRVHFVDDTRRSYKKTQRFATPTTPLPGRKLANNRSALMKYHKERTKQVKVDSGLKNSSPSSPLRPSLTTQTLRGSGSSFDVQTVRGTFDEYRDPFKKSRNKKSSSSSYSSKLPLMSSDALYGRSYGVQH